VRCSRGPHTSVLPGTTALGTTLLPCLEQLDQVSCHRAARRMTYPLRLAPASVSGLTPQRSCTHGARSGDSYCVVTMHVLFTTGLFFVFIAVISSNSAGTRRTALCVHHACSFRLLPSSTLIIGVWSCTIKRRSFLSVTSAAQHPPYFALPG
jgi:hypothetical protein